MKRLRFWILLGGALLAGAPQAKAVEIFTIGDPILAIDRDGLSPNSGSGYPAGEAPPLLIDGDVNTKYLNFGNVNSGFIVTPSAASTIRSFTLTTANDAPERNPTSYALYGTNDAITSPDNSFGNLENWTLISEGPVALPNTFMTTGPVVTFPNASSYTSYRMHFPTLNAPAAPCCMQLSEASFYASTDGTGDNLLTAGNPIIAVRVTPQLQQSNYPANEPPSAVLDGLSATKYLNFGENNSGFIVTPASGASIVDSFRITTANDAPARDPAEYQIYGTNAPIASTDNSEGDAETWTLISEGTLTLPEARLTASDVIPISNTTAYSSYRVVFPTVRDAEAANSMQVADVQFFAEDPLTLEVNRQTGQVRILSDDNFTFESYEVRSATAGGLDDTNWSSIATTGDQDNGGTIDPNDTWTETSTPGNANSIAETDGAGGADDGVTMTNGQAIDLGNIWLRTPFEDLVFDVRNATGFKVADGVTYVGDPIINGDFNYDGTVDAGDWPAFRAGLGGRHTGLSRAEAYLKGDLDGDFDTDIFDYNAFVALVPGGAGALTAVPEPSSMLLLGMGALMLAGRRVRRLGLKVAPVVAVGLAVTCMMDPAQAQTFTNIGQPAVPATTPDPVENDQSGPANLFDDTALDDDINPDLFVLNYADGTIFPPGSIGSLQYAGLGEAPKTVFMDFGSAKTPEWFSYAQRSGSDPTADRVGKFEFWFSNTDFGGTLPATAPNAVFEMDADDDRLQDSILRPYPLSTPGNGRYAAVRFTVSDLSEPRPTNNIGGHEFRFMDGPSAVVLEVDRSNGNMTIKNNGTGAQAFDLTAYEIKSAIGALDPGGFNGIRGDSAAFPTGNGTGNGWELGGGSNGSRLFESYLNTDSTLAAGVASLALGAAYNEAFVTEDLTFRFTNTAGRVFDGVVKYVGAAPPGLLPGDYNDDNIVDAADYTVWRDALGSGVTLPNDPTPGVNNEDDYSLWKTKFGTVAAGAGLGASSAVPEPSALALIGLASALCATVGFRRR